MKSLVDIEQLIKRMLAVLPSDCPPAALHEPTFKGNEWRYVRECLDTGWVSSVGKFVDRFEQMLADFTGMKRAVATVNGTAALHAALVLAGVERDDEVLMPTLTFIATANAVSYCGAIPHFVDSADNTLGIDPDKLEAYLADICEIQDGVCINRHSGRIIRAVVAMHVFGHPVDLDPLLACCNRFGIVLIEDAAESLGSFYKGKHTGHWGRLAALSFNGNKTVTSGGSGAILTNDEELGERAKHVTTTAKVPHPYEFIHDQVGFNYRLPNINAALGCAQMEILPSFLQQKRELAELYANAFADFSGVRFFREPSFGKSNYWLNSLLLDSAVAGDRDRVLRETNARGIMTRPVWRLMHRLPMFSGCPRMDLAVAEDLEQRIINVPSSPGLRR